jgi:hypothetical protein
VFGLFCAATTAAPSTAEERIEALILDTCSTSF